jgi:hypothetical protein
MGGKWIFVLLKNSENEKVQRNLGLELSLWSSSTDVTLEVRTQMNNPPRGATRDAKLPTLFFWRTAN